MMMDDADEKTLKTKDDYQNLVIALSKVAERIRKLAEYLAILTGLRENALQPLIKTLTRSEVIWIA